MEFVWNDGGRSASGFVGTTGDCVTRAIAIATGVAYREVYDCLAQISDKSPRHGMSIDIASDYLAERQWTRFPGDNLPFEPITMPKGVVIAHVSKQSGECNHMCTLIDRVVHDTWNAADDRYIIRSYWQPQSVNLNSPLPAAGPKRRVSKQQEMTQKEFDRVLRVLRALDKTASNHASTEAEKQNALRAMQALMLNNDLKREDIVDDANVNNVQFTRMVCAVNGRRACSWEKELANYVCDQILPSVQWYISTSGHRTLFSFFGPLSDVKNAVALFRELLLAIATAAKLQYGGFSRGSGASYAEGYVAGLPKRLQPVDPAEHRRAASEAALVQVRTLAVHTAATDWLRRECHVRLACSSRSGRNQHDPAAQYRGQLHGAKHDIRVPNAPQRITQR